MAEAKLLNQTRAFEINHFYLGLREYISEYNKHHTVQVVRCDFELGTLFDYGPDDFYRGQVRNSDFLHCDA